MHMPSSQYSCILIFFQIKRVLPPILAYYKYINIIYMVPINIFEIPIDTSYELNTYALLSVNLRQKESCDRYLYIYIEKKGSKKIMEIPKCTSYALISAFFRQKKSCHPYWNIKYIWFQPGLLKFP